MRVVVLSALAALAIAAPAQARSLRLVDDGRARGLVGASTDGRYVATPRGHGVHVLDARTGRARQIPTPPGCTFGVVGAATLVWTCYDQAMTVRGRTLELATGRAGSLPAPAARPEADFPSYDAIGTRSARIHYVTDHGIYDEYVDRVTGEQRPAPQSRALVADLDRAGLERRLCAGVLRPRMPEFVDYVAGPDLTERGEIAAITTAGGSPTESTRVLLERCGRPAQTIRRCTRTCDALEQPVLVGRFVAWRERTALHVRSLTGGATRVLALDEGARLVGAAHSRIYLTQRKRLKHVAVG